MIPHTDSSPTDLDGVTLGRARADELPALVTLLGEAVPDCLPETVWQLPWSWHRYFVAREAGGRIIASGALEPVDDDRAEIRGLVVAPDHRGRGLASAVVERLLGEARSRELDAVCVTRKPEFFRRFGFLDTPCHWLRLERRLAPKSGHSRVGMRLRLNAQQEAVQ